MTAQSKSVLTDAIEPETLLFSVPVAVLIHGGGWVVGGKSTHDRLVREIAHGAEPGTIHPFAVLNSLATHRLRERPWLKSTRRSATPLCKGAGQSATSRDAGVEIDQRTAV